jgi:hypothetical protein
MRKKSVNVKNDFGQIYGELKNSLTSESAEKMTEEESPIEKKTIDKKTTKEKPTRKKSIEKIVNDAKPMKELPIEKISTETKPADQNTPSGKYGIGSTTLRVVKEELVKALGGQTSGEIKIGEIVPLTGTTRRTVDRVCKHLEKTGELSFERLHRGMRVTILKP